VNGTTNTFDSLLDLNGTRAVINGLFSQGYLTRVIITNSSATPATLVVGDNDANGAFAGIIRNGAGAVALTKIGAGVETLSGANSYTGATIISNGTLIVNGSISSVAVGVMNGGTLSGSGVIGGVVTVSLGGTIRPGNSLGILVANSGATLNGTTAIELNQLLATNDVLRSISSVNYGGLLSLTNLSGTLTTNDRFKVFDAPTYSGTFTNIVPAIPAVGLAWNTNTLASDGTLRIAAVPTQQPQISGISISGSNLVISGTNGVPGWPYLVLSSTNLTMPLSGWTINATNAFDSGGNTTFTNPMDPSAPQSFYLLRLQ
jgi:autotransporter-associated beta strand protein